MRSNYEPTKEGKISSTVIVSGRGCFGCASFSSDNNAYMRLKRKDWPVPMDVGL